MLTNTALEATASSSGKNSSGFTHILFSLVVTLVWLMAQPEQVHVIRINYHLNITAELQLTVISVSE